jgi:hypothetical protein
MFPPAEPPPIMKPLVESAPSSEAFAAALIRKIRCQLKNILEKSLGTYPL